MWPSDKKVWGPLVRELLLFFRVSGTTIAMSITIIVRWTHALSPTFVSLVVFFGAAKVITGCIAVKYHTLLIAHVSCVFQMVSVHCLVIN